MPCTLKDLAQPVCLTIIYNLSNRTLVDSFIDCGECNLKTELDPVNKNLTIRVPLVLEGEVTFGDNPFQSGCVTTGVHLG
ncbi:hypothetical protein ACJTM1_29320 [Bacillus sp. GX]|uniref:hypothetical protein n=1 Tax=Bacillus TaxID=1386 RepID=UPI000B4A6759|nr:MULTISPECIES: hypothetical protein [Bacillus]RXJ09872.1 hypothetical protein ETJ91_30380 [Bacillus albus]RXJ21771.1 hypothetical protein ETJ90_30340 [Bacillus albus]RXJ22809.1 hypothetical protein ETJ76_30485 [Bacillus albus]RXJ33823.1 hypothetical protein ETJ89_30440 [Bacillus albus]RXJ50346.1 hypothetical protein ETJ66_30285 [Bacillus albus]